MVYHYVMLMSIALTGAAAIGLIMGISDDETEWGYPGFSDEIVLLIVGTLLTVFARQHVKANARLAESAPEDQAPVPAPPLGGVGIGLVDPAAETPRLRRFGLWSAVLAPLFLPLVAAGIYVIALPWIESAELLDTGKRANGTVVEVPDRGSMWVEYWVRGERRESLIRKHYDHEYEPYQSVMVLYHPEDRARVRTDVEANTQRFGKAGAFPLAIGAVGFVCSVRAAAGWRRRYRLVTAAGWRPALATVTRDYDRTARHPLAIHLAFEDGTELVARSVSWTIRSPFVFRKVPGTQVHVGGEGQDMVVLFYRGWMTLKPYSVPVRADLPKVRRKAKV